MTYLRAFVQRLLTFLKYCLLLSPTLFQSVFWPLRRQGAVTSYCTCLSLWLSLSRLWVPPEQGTGFICLCISIIYSWAEINSKGNKENLLLKLWKQHRWSPKERYLIPRAHSLSHVQLFSTPWTVAHQAHLSMEFPGKNTGVGCHFLLQALPNLGIKSSSSVSLLHCRWILYSWTNGEVISITKSYACEKAYWFSISEV